MSEKLAAHYENRTYFFKIVNKSADEISIDMYGTAYTFVKKNTQWANKTGNKMNMVQGLIDAVILTVQEHG